MPFLADAMTGTSAANITSRAGEIGATWVQHAVNTFTILISNAGRARGGTSGAAGNTVYASGLPQTREVHATFDVFIAAVTASSSAGIYTRLQTAALTGYLYRYAYNAASANRWEIRTTIAGVSTTIANSANKNYAAGTTTSCEVYDQNGSQKIVVGGVTEASAADTNASLQIDGRIGVNLSVPAAGSDTTQFHLDNLVVDDLWLGPAAQRPRPNTLLRM